ncbi:MAG TPA: hypothetical protein VKC60_12145, partial [Opitutaceae bacterium]|nr:hypothetical protein [Opitutaceae bacterium]
RIDGRARIRARGGQTYIITPEAVHQKRITVLPDFSGRRKRLFNRTLSTASARQFDQAIAGE